MITNNVTEILMCIFSFSSNTDIEEYLQYGKELLDKYANGMEIKTNILK